LTPPRGAGSAGSQAGTASAVADGDPCTQDLCDPETGEVTQPPSDGCRVPTADWQLLPAAALGGAAFLVICDTAVRTLPAGRELPVGALTALAGGPFFLWLLRRSARRNWSALPW